MIVSGDVQSATNAPTQQLRPARFAAHKQTSATSTTSFLAEDAQHARERDEEHAETDELHGTQMMLTRSLHLPAQPRAHNDVHYKETN